MRSALTWSASAVWSFLSATARNLSDAGVLKSAKLDARVISVGNIQAGGAGKTPLVARIAREAVERGLRVCILCRGYQGEWEVSGGVILPGAGVTANICGDEAALLHELVPEAWIGVGADRVKQYERAKKEAGVAFDLVILDDGFQHWKIRKDLEVVAVTSAKRTELLHRDWPRALSRADLVVWTKGDTENGHGSRVRVQYELPPPLFSGPVWLVTGLAHDKAALKTIREAGYSVQRHVSFPDHARYSQPVVEELLESARRNGCQIVLTGKDWVKWKELGVSRAQVQVLEPELKFLEGRELWDRKLWGA